MKYKVTVQISGLREESVSVRDEKTQAWVDGRKQVERMVETIYEQTVDDLDVAAIVQVVNKLKE